MTLKEKIIWMTSNKDTLNDLKWSILNEATACVLSGVGEILYEASGVQFNRCAPYLKMFFEDNGFKDVAIEPLRDKVKFQVESKTPEQYLLNPNSTIADELGIKLWLARQMINALHLSLSSTDYEVFGGFINSKFTYDLEAPDDRIIEDIDGLWGIMQNDFIRGVNGLQNTKITILKHSVIYWDEEEFTLAYSPMRFTL